MSGPSSALAQQQKQKNLTTQETQQSLKQLQTWDAAQGESVQERRQAHSDKIIADSQHVENVQLQKKAQRENPPVEAQEVAKGKPVQEQAPASRTPKKALSEKAPEKQAPR